MAEIVWTDYLKYRAELRGFSIELLENIVRYTDERYYDTETGRYVFVGRHRDDLVMIPCDIDEKECTPVTVHSVTRQQIRFRLNTGRLKYE